MFWVGLIVGAPAGWLICMVLCLPHQKAKWEAEQDGEMAPEERAAKHAGKTAKRAAKEARKASASDGPPEAK
jgi:hypothetical protein